MNLVNPENIGVLKIFKTPWDRGRTSDSNIRGELRGVPSAVRRAASLRVRIPRAAQLIRLPGDTNIMFILNLTQSVKN